MTKPTAIEAIAAWCALDAVPASSEMTRSVFCDTAEWNALSDVQQRDRTIANLFDEKAELRDLIFDAADIIDEQAATITALLDQLAATEARLSDRDDPFVDENSARILGRIKRWVASSKDKVAK